MKKRMALISLLLTAAMLLTACMASAEKTDVRIAVLKGPTGMGAASLMDKNDKGEAENAYTFTIAGAPDAITAQLVTGELDIAALPTNVIAMLNQKTEGKVSALAINTLGVLYLLEKGDSIQSIEDLKGKVIVSAGKGTTAEALAIRLFPADATVDYVAEHAEAVTQAVSGKYDHVLLPEPFVTSLLAQNADFRVALNIAEAWDAEGLGALPMGGVAVRAEFAKKNPAAVEAFLAEYKESVDYANSNPAEASVLIEKYDIMMAAVAEEAIPRCNMVLMTGDEMKEALISFYTVLLENNPALIGGAMPGDGFYYASTEK